MSDVICAAWPTVVGTLLSGAVDGRPYHISAMYVEFENNAGAAVSLPATVEGEDASTYYNAIHAGSELRDYLRIPLVTSFYDPTTSKLRCFAQTADGVGEQGALVFSDAQQSRVYGGALVATPVLEDPTQDLIIARFYFAAADQIIKTGGMQISIVRELVFA